MPTEPREPRAGRTGDPRSQPGEPEARGPAELDDRPPVLGSWRAIYAVVLGALAVVIALLWALTEVYR